MLHPAPRYRVVVPVRYHVDGPRGPSDGTGWTRDISGTGAALDLPEPLAPPTRLALVLSTETRSLSIPAAAVVWVSPSRQPGGMSTHGVRFTSHTEETEQLRVWLHRQPVARVAAALPARCERLDVQEAPVDGWTSDVSAGGCALFLPERMPVGTLLDVVLSTPAGEVRSRGVIVWEGRGGRPTERRLCEHGFRFTESPGVQPALATALEKILAARAAG